MGVHVGGGGGGGGRQMGVSMCGYVGVACVVCRVDDE